MDLVCVVRCCVLFCLCLRCRSCFVLLVDLIGSQCGYRLVSVGFVVVVDCVFEFCVAAIVVCLFV